MTWLGDIPSLKLFESDKTFAFLDINPLSYGHAVRPAQIAPLLTVTAYSLHSQLVIPKFHGAKLTDIPDDSLAELLPVAKKIATATGSQNYNILQNNGRLAHQMVDHVHGMIARTGRRPQADYF